ISERLPKFSQGYAPLRQMCTINLREGVACSGYLQVILRRARASVGMVGLIALGLLTRSPHTTERFAQIDDVDSGHIGLGNWSKVNLQSHRNEENRLNEARAEGAIEVHRRTTRV